MMYCLEKSLICLRLEEFFYILKRTIKDITPIKGFSPMLILVIKEAVRILMRAPLLWFFSFIDILLIYFWQYYSQSRLLYPELMAPLFPSCVGLILIPMMFLLILVPTIILAPACQIRVVQLIHIGDSQSVSKIIRYCVHRFWALAGLFLLYGFIAVLGAIVLLIALKGNLKELSPFNWSYSIIFIFLLFNNLLMLFAVCGIVISEVPFRLSLLLPLRLLKVDKFSIFTIIVIFIIGQYLCWIIFPYNIESIPKIALSIIVQLVLNSIEATIFTLAYLYLAESQGEKIQEIIAI